MSSFSIENTKKRNIALDIIKVLGVIFITNAHSWDLWEIIDRRIATGGVQGVTFFFFVSGFAMMIGKTKCKSCVEFVRDKIKRLWPPLIIWSLLSNALGREEITWKTFFALEFRYWFISCIFIYYIITFFIVKGSVAIKWCVLLAGVFFSVIITLFLPKVDHSIYIDYHYYYYLVSMILGMIVAQTTSKYIMMVQNQKFFMRFLWLIMSMVCCLSYFVIIEKSKGMDNPYYYMQLLALLPLNLMVLFIYFAFSGISVNNFVANHKILRWPIVAISQLSLEIYIVQFVVISGKFNDLFPYSFLINYLFVFMVAYCLKVLTKIFINIFNKKKIDPYDWIIL